MNLFTHIQWEQSHWCLLGEPQADSRSLLNKLFKAYTCVWANCTCEAAGCTTDCSHRGRPSGSAPLLLSPGSPQAGSTRSASSGRATERHDSDRWFIDLLFAVTKKKWRFILSHTKHSESNLSCLCKAKKIPSYILALKNISSGFFILSVVDFTAVSLLCTKSMQRWRLPGTFSYCFSMLHTPQRIISQIFAGMFTEYKVSALKCCSLWYLRIFVACCLSCWRACCSLMLLAA